MNDREPGMRKTRSNRDGGDLESSCPILKEPQQISVVNDCFIKTGPVFLDLLIFFYIFLI